MKELQIVSIIFLLIGILMVLFRRSLGVIFCKTGTRIFKSSSPLMKKCIEMSPINPEAIYDEKRAPFIMMFLGIVNILQSPVFLILSFIMRD
jgi:hypothetical protein